MGSCCCNGKKCSVPDRVSESPKIIHADNEHEIIKTVPLLGQSMPLARLNKAGFNKKNPLELIEGYQNEPLVSLEEALECFTDTIDYLFEQIKEAKSNCYYPSAHDLTRDESAAIYLYSMRDTNSVYYHLEKAWESWDKHEMKPWFKYLNLLKSALDKLPEMKNEIWQGLIFNETDEAILKEDPLVVFTCMNLCFTSKEDIIAQLDQTPVSQMIFVGYESVDGRDVTLYVKNSSNGIMIFPGVKLNKMIIEENSSDGSVTMHLTKSIDLNESEQEMNTESSPEFNVSTSNSTEFEENSSSSTELEESRPSSTTSEPLHESLITTAVPSPVPVQNDEMSSLKHFVCPSKTCRNYCNHNYSEVM